MFLYTATAVSPLFRFGFVWGEGWDEPKNGREGALCPDGLPLCLRACLITCSGVFREHFSRRSLPQNGGKIFRGGGETNFYFLERATFSPQKVGMWFMKKKTICLQEIILQQKEEEGTWSRR